MYAALTGYLIAQAVLYAVGVISSIWKHDAAATALSGALLALVSWFLIAGA